MPSPLSTSIPSGVISRRSLVQFGIGCTGLLPIARLSAETAAPPAWKLEFKTNANCAAEAVLTMDGNGQVAGRELPSKNGELYLSKLLRDARWDGVAYDVAAMQVVIMLLNVKDKCGVRITFGEPDDFQGSIGFENDASCTGHVGNVEALKKLRMALWRNEAFNQKNIPVEVTFEIAK